MHRISRTDGFSITELLVSMAVSLVLAGSAIGTFKNGLAVNDSAAQLSDTNQNLRAGTNQLIRDIMQAGRIIGTEGIPMPTGNATAFSRPGPSALTFSLIADADTTLNLPSITTGYQLGPRINGTSTDIITIMTVDEFMPVISTPPAVSGSPTPIEGTIAPNGQSVTLPLNSLWLTGDTVNDSAKMQVGDLVLVKNALGTALQTITSMDSTHIYFGNNLDWFHFNQFSASQVPIILIKQTPTTTSVWGTNDKTSLFRAMMITYYVDNTTTPGSPRLMRQVNHYTPQALAGIVEDLDVTYDLVDGINNPTNITSLPFTDAVAGVTYNSNQIRKVNLHLGVRSETISKPAQDYVRNHISTSVGVRSLASVARYVSQ